MKKTIANWGQYPCLEADELHFREEEEIAEIIGKSASLIARGRGRCYGDASLGETVVSTTRFNKFISFDRDRGILDCQAGVSLEEVLKLVVPAGWFLPVTPGTKFITVGGAVASDVHGKNHHKEGSFCKWVLDFSLMNSKGEQVLCSREHNAELFETSCGGMGLTGIITRVRFQLKAIETAYIKQTQLKAANLKEVFQLFEQYRDVTYTVAWIDCLQSGDSLGRSILMLGEHAQAEELPRKLQQAPLQLSDKLKLSVPFNFPSFTLNSYSIKAFNFAYYHKLRKQQQSSIASYDSFFYPLDFVHHWNRMYGPKGFVQYQFVLPLHNSYEGLTTILQRISKKGMGSFLAVLKLFGPQEQGLISFPMEGYTLALDFPVCDGLFPFLDELDELVHELGGRIYLSKDARMKSSMFFRGYPGAVDFIRSLESFDPDHKFVSLQRKRLAIPA
ncbi:FAD-binding oxidoreductase [Cesiribacter sp. SM1]|uniref:FAD-binding oxidoreductase n=1 Tax=Cesiribacter sp. SM1 TaxID=2861196 RepID=UPI001CD4DA8D|nr:FAD-binding oxidoreductase [Cesiribacter sp. SM1]